MDCTQPIKCFLIKGYSVNNTAPRQNQEAPLNEPICLGPLLSFHGLLLEGRTEDIFHVFHYMIRLLHICLFIYPRDCLPLSASREEGLRIVPRSEICLDPCGCRSKPFFSQVSLGFGIPSAWQRRLAATPGSWA